MMATIKRIKEIIADQIHVHCLEAQVTVAEVWHCYMENSEDFIVNIEDAFELCGFEINYL
jgi:hypothetical protein